jgi:hypothetical protein
MEALSMHMPSELNVSKTVSGVANEDRSSLDGTLPAFWKALRLIVSAHLQ